MSEALWRKYVGDQFELNNSGLDPEVINPNTFKVMEDMV